jgi:anti-sigma B factor antagonist
MSGDDYPLRRLGPHAVITMPAEIDMTNSDRVCQALMAGAGPGVAVLIVDMSETTFCDSAGVHAVITAHRHAADSGTQLWLVAAAVLRIFTIVGADQLIPVFPTLTAALAEAATVPSRPHDPGGE